MKKIAISLILTILILSNVYAKSPVGVQLYAGTDVGANLTIKTNDSFKLLVGAGKNLMKNEKYSTAGTFDARDGQKYIYDTLSAVNPKLSNKFHIDLGFITTTPDDSLNVGLLFKVGQAEANLKTQGLLGEKVNGKGTGMSYGADFLIQQAKTGIFVKVGFITNSVNELKGSGYTLKSNKDFNSTEVNFSAGYEF